MRFMPFKSLIAGFVLMFAIVGCSGSEAAPATSDTQPSTTVAMAKCAGCAKEVPQAELASHDGQMLCKDCIAAHNH